MGCHIRDLPIMMRQVGGGFMVSVLAAMKGLGGKRKL